MQKIIPHIWYDKEAKQAAEWYVSIFGGNSEVMSVKVLKNTPSGDCDMVSFRLWDCEFMSISAGPFFKPNPSVSFMVNFDPSQDADAKEKIDAIWNQLREGGKILMPLDQYPFSERYGWVEDKYGVSWQLIFTKPEGEKRPLILPSLLFVQNVCGKAKEASDFYISVFQNAPAASGETKPGIFAPYPAGMEPDKEGTTMFTDFMLQGQWIVAMDSAREHGYAFNEGISLIVNCDTQEEIDYFWEKLSVVPEVEQCGWLKDKYGLSWQIVPTDMNTMMAEGTPEQIDRVTQAFLPMKKFDLAKLREAYNGKTGA